MVDGTMLSKKRKDKKSGGATRGGCRRGDQLRANPRRVRRLTIGRPYIECTLLLFQCKGYACFVGSSSHQNFLLKLFAWLQILFK